MGTVTIQFENIALGEIIDCNLICLHISDNSNSYIY